MVVNITVLVSLPIVSAILFVRSIKMSIGDIFSVIFLAIFDTNTFFIKRIAYMQNLPQNDGNNRMMMMVGFNVPLNTL